MLFFFLPHQLIHRLNFIHHVFTTPSCALKVSKSIAWEVSFKGIYIKPQKKLLFYHINSLLSFRDEMNLKCSTFSVWLQERKRGGKRRRWKLNFLTHCHRSSTWYYCRSKANNRFLLIHSILPIYWLLCICLLTCSCFPPISSPINKRVSELKLYRVHIMEWLLQEE